MLALLRVSGMLSHQVAPVDGVRVESEVGVGMRHDDPRARDDDQQRRRHLSQQVHRPHVPTNREAACDLKPAGRATPLLTDQRLKRSRCTLEETPHQEHQPPKGRRFCVPRRSRSMPLKRRRVLPVEHSMQLIRKSFLYSPALAEGVHQDGAVCGAREHQVQLRTDGQARHLPDAIATVASRAAT